ncbi:DUF6464 family protein [Ancylothrix sp. C2]|uniref:DUF6464 family protein n=1 Tax=Ancylothrix sp. D3o TaxID=2953691 RepID=UPI0021BAD645|nr:DUF6464 family protein [Ancylothrix sp. D3o]MCT7948376.1 DUF6464 family protein [Ancylothrix sp. D3o]
MLEIVLIFTIALTPPLVSLWKWRQTERTVGARLLAARQSASLRRLPAVRGSTELYNPVLIAQQVGDATCRFNARSPYIRCAVNPDGPCEGCRHYQKRE